MTPVAGAGKIESEIYERIRAAKIRLRFDKVVRGLDARLQTALATKISDGQSVVFTMTAPIKLPSQTAAALEELFNDGVPAREIRKTVHGNRVRIRPLSGLRKRMPKVLVLVHNPDSDAGTLLSIAESRLRQGTIPT